MNAPTVEAFRAAAEAFCLIAQGKEPLDHRDLYRLRELLLQLIFHVTAVENHPHDRQREGKPLRDDAFGQAVERFSHFPFNLYRVVFDPHDFEADDEPVTGMLSDDLADIYRDLAPGLDNARSGHLDDACFDWSESYRCHWSHHAVNALKAIESFRMDHEP
ncbi:MAG: DUF5063 domain-containing protein [Verrucomicrobiota bacterium]